MTPPSLKPPFDLEKALAKVQAADFTDFHKKLAKKFQEQSTPEKLKEAFKSFVDNKNDINFKSVLSMKATFEPAPTFGRLQTKKHWYLLGIIRRRPNGSGSA